MWATVGVDTRLFCRDAVFLDIWPSPVGTASNADVFVARSGADCLVESGSFYIVLVRLVGEFAGYAMGEWIRGILVFVLGGCGSFAVESTVFGLSTRQFARCTAFHTNSMCVVDGPYAGIEPVHEHRIFRGATG